MTDEPRETTATPRPRRRNTLIVDKSMQLGAVVSVVGIAACCGLLAFVSHVWSGGDRGLEMTSDEASRLAFAADALFAGSAVAAVAIYVVWLTHRFAGPARVLQNALDGLVVDDFGRRMQLRKNDFLKGVAESACRVARKMRAERDDLCALVDELDDLLARDDVGASRAALDSFRARRGLVRAEQAAAEAPALEADFSR